MTIVMNNMNAEGVQTGHTPLRYDLGGTETELIWREAKGRIAGGG